MTTPLEYEETAYDSTRPRELPPPVERSERGILAREWLKHPLENPPTACGEYLHLGGYDDELIRMFQAGELDAKVKEYPLEEHWGSHGNPYMWAEQIRFLSALAGWVGLIGLIFISLVWFPDYRPQELETIKGNAYFCAGAVAVHYFLRFIMKLGIIPSLSAYEFNRRTGMVYVRGTGKIPFDEFAPYLHKIVSPQGRLTYHLVLGHQYSDLHILALDDKEDPGGVKLHWEALRQFMDVSKPLPDVPSAEPHRPYDPTTVKWDKRMGRPPDFWRTFPVDEYQPLTFRVSAACKAFPWGRTRRQALYGGWWPSCYGEMTWWDRPEPKREEEKTDNWQRCHGLPEETNIEDYYQRDENRLRKLTLLKSLFNTVYEAREKTLAMAKALLAEHELDEEDREQFIAYVEGMTKGLDEFAATREEIERLGPNGSISGRLGNPFELQAEWLREIDNQTAIRWTRVKYEHADDAEAQRAEQGRIHIEAIIAALGTLQNGEADNGDMNEQTVLDTVGAFLVDLVAAEQQLDEGEVALLNRIFAQTLTGEQYIERYAGKLDGDTATKALVALLIDLKDFNGPLGLLVTEQVEKLVNAMIDADGAYDEYEWRKASVFRELLGEALEVELEPPKKPVEITK